MTWTTGNTEEELRCMELAELQIKICENVAIQMALRDCRLKRRFARRNIIMMEEMSRRESNGEDFVDGEMILEGARHLIEQIL